MSTGVPQGLTSSPLLFNIFALTLIEELGNKTNTTLLYADDIIGINNST
jgi:hypothetical protein